MNKLKFTHVIKRRDWNGGSCHI